VNLLARTTDARNLFWFSFFGEKSGQAKKEENENFRNFNNVSGLN